MFTQKTGIVVKGSGLSGLYFVWLRELSWNWNSGSSAVSFYRIKSSSNNVFCRLVLSYTKKISKHSLPGPQKIPYLCLKLPFVRKKTTNFSAKTTLSKFIRGNNFIYCIPWQCLFICRSAELIAPLLITTMLIKGGNYFPHLNWQITNFLQVGC